MCSSPAVACNGACLGPGASANGCVYLTRVQSLHGLAVSGGDVFAALSFPYGAHAEQPPPAGLYRIDGTTSQLTPLDTDQGSNVSAIAVADDTVYYMQPGTISDGYIRSVPASGGTPVERVTAIEDGRGLWPIGERLYFSAALQADKGAEAVHWLPIAGGNDPQATQLTNASRVRINQTTIVTSFNGNIKTAPLPDLAPVTSLMGDFAPPLDQWWIDDQYVYWDNDGSYKRSPLTTVGATEADGEFVTTLPSGMSVQADVGSELFLSATVEGVTGFFVMPINGGTPTQIAVLGAPGPKLLAADADHVYVSSGFGLIRIDRR